MNPPQGSWRVSLVLPAFNEEASIREAVLEADAALGRIAREHEILVVDDGSSDATAEIVSRLIQERPHIRLLRHGRNRGYGAALRTGFEEARHDLIAFTDADRQFYLEDLGLLLEAIDDTPVVVGYRLDRQDSPLRCFLSRGYNLLARTLLGTGVRDCDCALKVFRRDVLKRLLPESTGFFVNSEMLTRARLLGYHVSEVGVRHRPRARGASTVSLADVPRTLQAFVPFWWTRVLFPQGQDPARGRSRPETLLPLLTLVLVVASLVFLGRLSSPLLEPQEPRYAEIPRQMLQEGTWLVPTLHDEPYLDKPPLFYWLVMGGYRLLGVHDWVARLVVGLVGVLVVGVTFLWGRRVVGDRAALCGALMLCLSARFVYMQRMLTIDSLLCLCVVAGLGSGHLAIAGARLGRGWWLGSAVACGLGLLTKGPVALVLVALPLFAFQLLEPRSARPGVRAWAGYVLVACLVAAPWYAGLLMREPEFAIYFFWTHNVVRFFEPFDHAKPFWYYLPDVLVGLLPWSLLLPALVSFLGRRSRRTAARRPAALGFFLIASAWILAFFSASGCKRPLYILPAFPPLALALGSALDVLLVPATRRHAWAPLAWRGFRLAYQGTLLMLLVGAGVVVGAAVRGMVSPLTAAFFLTLAGAVLLILVAARPKVSWLACAATTLLLLLGGIHGLLPRYASYFALRSQLLLHVRLFEDEKVRVVCYPQRWESVSFYLPEAEVTVYGLSQREELLRHLEGHPETILLVKSGRVLEDLLQRMPPSLEFVTRGNASAVTVGWVRPRVDVLDFELASRSTSPGS